MDFLVAGLILAFSRSGYVISVCPSIIPTDILKVKNVQIYGPENNVAEKAYFFRHSL
jgi:hypothetical protein